jgi:hypothetical protein
MGETLNKIEDPALRAAAAHAALGRRAVELWPLISKGAAGMAESTAQAKRWALGFADAGKSIFEANKAQKAADIAMGSLRQSIANAAASAFAPLKKAWADATVGFVDFVQPIMQFLRDGIGGAATLIGDLVNGVKKGFEDWAGPIGQAWEEMQEAWHGLGEALGLSGDFRDTIRGLARAAGEAVGWFVKMEAHGWATIAKFATTIATKLQEWADTIGGYVQPTIDAVADTLKPLLFFWGTLKETSMAVFDWLSGMFRSTSDDLASDFGPVLNWFVGAWDTMKSGVYAVAGTVKGALVEAIELAHIGFEKFIAALGHLPGKSGEIFRKAAADMKNWNATIKGLPADVTGALAGIKQFGRFDVPGAPTGKEPKELMDLEMPDHEKKSKGPEALSFNSKEALQVISASLGRGGDDVATRHYEAARANLDISRRQLAALEAIRAANGPTAPVGVV